MVSTMASKRNFRSVASSLPARPSRSPLAVGDAGFRVGVKHREIELVFGGVEIDEETIDFVQHGGGAGIGAVDFIQDHDGRQLGLQSFLQDVARLRKGTFAGVNEQEHAIDHAQGSLDFAAEIAVAGRIHDIDARIVIKKRGVLGQDGDATLALEFVGVHNALGDFLIAAEDAALTEHGVDQSSLAVVDVGDDSDIADGFIHKL